MQTTTRSRRLRRALRILATTAFCVGLVAGPSAVPALGVSDLHAPGRLPDSDARVGRVAPTATQLQTVADLGAHATWNRFGTPQSLIRYGGYLATGLGSDAVAAARSFVVANHGLFRLSETTARNLEVLADTRMIGTPGHAVIFRQRFGGLPAVQDGLITVAVTGGKVAYVSSSSAGEQALSGTVRLSPVQAWLRAAQSLGIEIDASALTNVHKDGGWTTFQARSFAQPQLSRLRAFPTIGNGARPAYETIVENVQGGIAMAYTVVVDAETGAVLFRRNAVQELTLAAPQGGFFQGATGGNGQCGPLHEFAAPPGTKSIDVVASADNPINDIVLNLVYVTGGNVTVASADTATSPEAVHYDNGGSGIVPPGTYAAQVCPFEPSDPPFTYTGFYSVNDTVAATFPYPPKWKFFENAPPLDYATTDTRKVGCWEDVVSGSPVADCDSPPSPLKNIASRGPWDFDFRTNQPTFTSRGNNANTAEAWTSPLTPGPTNQRPVDPDRTYGIPDSNPTEDWTNQWFESKCDPEVFGTPQRNDVLAAVTNLFAGHNRFHDFSYFLGFTETNFNMQDTNFGNTPPGGFPFGREEDPEIGNVQAGAVDGGPPTFRGRDNANQITLNDGIPGITNQYLFQPIAGAFYAPCVDGDFDSTVFGHEYTHAISNRMVGGPDSGLSGFQAGSMGESWSDLNALEYLHEFDLVPLDGENPWAEGPYVTGNKQTGIRDYALNDNPLNYSDIGFDLTGPEVHADGEIWNGTNYELRQLLVAKYDGLGFPSTDTALQARCARGELPADQCPGNRRWIQIVYDAWLMMPATVSMLDARDAYLAADVMRFGGANQVELWRGFARRGMGADASTDTNNDTDPVPSFRSPAEPNATLGFQVVAADGGTNITNASIFVGDYQARAMPVADTDPGTALPASAQFVPGLYHFVARAPGYGLFRFTLNVASPTNQTVTVEMPSNWASKARGATASGDGVNHQQLIDDDEGTNWARLDATPSADGSRVQVKLGGGAHTVRRVQVSAMLHPANPDDQNDPDSQSRFTALRQFSIQTCRKTSTVLCTQPADFTTIFTSPADAFPSILPRPLAPDLIIRSFDVPDTPATHVRLIVVHNQCTGGPAYQGEQDNDPTNDTDCDEASAQGETVRAAELEVFSTDGDVQASASGGVLATGHAHTDYDNDGQAGVHDVHIMLNDVASGAVPSGSIGYDDLRKNPPGPAFSNIRCGGPVTAVTKLSSDTIRIRGTLTFCNSLSAAKTFTLVVTDNGPNPPNQDAYHMTMFNKKGQVVYDWADDTTVGLGDIDLS